MTSDSRLISSGEALDIDWVRAQFPSLELEVDGRQAAFLDGPGGTQVPRRVIEAIAHYLRTHNANTGGAYLTSGLTDEMIAEARSAMADFLAGQSDEIVLGPNMTSLTYSLSRALGRELRAGDEIVLTHLDHDANVSPWRALEERGVIIRLADIREENCTLDLDDLASKINARTKIVAFTYASNAVGSIVDVKKVVRLAHDAGALAYLDAVHFAPHGAIDVGELECDFLVCSPYKFFGPHMGVLWGKREHLARFTPYKVRANTDAVPQRWEWGTLNHELIAGITATIEYLEALGQVADERCALSRREALLAAYVRIGAHERRLMERMLEGFAGAAGVRLYGITDRRLIEHRCPTFALRIDGRSPRELAQELGEQGIFVWDGNYFALNLSERLGVETDGGFLRVGFVHYNTLEEVDRVLEALVP
jgi:cysteine desulfurase family protein (TIGR01976 family)